MRRAIGSAGTGAVAITVAAIGSRYYLFAFLVWGDYQPRARQVPHGKTTRLINRSRRFVAAGRIPAQLHGTRCSAAKVIPADRGYRNHGQPRGIIRPRMILRGAESYQKTIIVICKTSTAKTLYYSDTHIKKGRVTAPANVDDSECDLSAVDAAMRFLSSLRNTSAPEYQCHLYC